MNILPLNDQMLDEVGRLFATLGDPSRLRILRVLLDGGGPLSQGAVAEAARLSQPNASKHLAQLVQAGLVTREQRGSTVLFCPVTPMVPEVCALVCRHVADRIQNVHAALA